MLQSTRYKLHGTYRAPRFRYESKVEDEVRGEVIIVALSDARIPWPLARREGFSPRGLVVYGGLAKAIRCESIQAVAYHWGVTAQTVTAWRRALGIKGEPDGTSTLRKAYGQEPWFKRAQKLAWKKAQDPERCAKIAESRRGKPRPPEVMEALRAANAGREASLDTRRKMSEAHKSRPKPAMYSWGRPWTPEEDQLCRTLSIKEAAQRTGRSIYAIKARRLRLGLPDGRLKANRVRGDGAQQR